jgi:hypothetical protein
VAGVIGAGRVSQTTKEGLAKNKILALAGVGTLRATIPQETTLEISMVEVCTDPDCLLRRALSWAGFEREGDGS